jgi:uncharacterized protein (TIGR03437 family)
VDSGQTISVELSGVPYSYTTVAGDTLESVATNLASVVNGDPNVTATADTALRRVTLTLKNPAQTPKVTFKVTFSTDSTISAVSQATNSQAATVAGVSFAGPVKGGVGLYQINFTVPSDQAPNPATKFSLSQNLIVFGSVTERNIFSNTVTFPVGE